MAQAVSTRGPVSGTATAGKKRRKLFLLDLYGTAVGKKYAMALSGIALMGFVLVHMIGNLKMYPRARGDQPLRRVPPRAAGAAGAAHGRAVDHADRADRRCRRCTSTPRTASPSLNRHARSVKYQSARDYQVANFASRTMRWTGIIVLLFLFLHLADLTWGWVNPGFVRGDVYRNLDASLSRVPVAALYIVANIALGVHLFHGAWSLFQSMGWNSPRFNKWRRGFAIGFATLITVGNVSFVVAVLAGVVGN